MNRLARRIALAGIIVFFSFGEIWAQESRPTDQIRPPELDAMPKISSEESERRLRDAMLLYDRGKTDAAIYMLQQLEKVDPMNYKVLFKLGEMAIAAKNWAYSINVLRKASYIRPKDIEVRLILIDIFKAYQMPIQGIIVAKEILALDPSHIIATQQLAELYQDQAMLDDEIKIRQQLKNLVPDDYQNLKRLAVIFDNSGELWEAARVYEQIRKYHPQKINDMTRLAAIYGQLGHYFRELRVVDQLEEEGEKRKWLKARGKKGLRKEHQTVTTTQDQIQIYDIFGDELGFRDQQREEYDIFKAGLGFGDEEQEDIDVFTPFTVAEYIHTRPRSSIDVGVETKLERLQHTGKNLLIGDMDINSATIIGKAIKYWQNQDYTLTARLGVLVDDVQGSLRPSDPNSGITAVDFPFLEDPSFKSYGGVMPVGSLKFLAKPGLRSSYRIAYEHAQMKDLDARLFMYSFDKVRLSYDFQAEDNTELLLLVDESLISDGNRRFHGLVAAKYMLLGSNPIHDYADQFNLPIWRNSFLRNPPRHYLTVGYIWNYFDDKDTETEIYEVFDNEKRHTFQVEARTRIYNRGEGRNVFLKFIGRYSFGTTLDYRREAGIKLTHSTDLSEIGLSFNFEEELSTNVSENLLIGGKTRNSLVLAFIALKF